MTGRGPEVLILGAMKTRDAGGAWSTANCIGALIVTNCIAVEIRGVTGSFSLNSGRMKRDTAGHGVEKAMDAGTTKPTTISISSTYGQRLDGGARCWVSSINGFAFLLIPRRSGDVPFSLACQTRC